MECAPHICMEKITAGNQTLLRLKIQLEENAKNIARIKDEKKRADELREVYLKAG